MKILVLKFAWWFLLAPALMGVRLYGLDAAGKLEVFNIETSPKQSDWQAFFKLQPDVRKKLWDYHAKRSKTLGDWAWEWRLGWVKACGKSSQMYCGLILENALKDQALVVRAEAATTIGNRYAGTGYKRATELLVEAYSNPNNHRNKKPLWVQFRILEAMKKIGGKQTKGQASELSRQDARTQSYWKKITKF